MAPLPPDPRAAPMDSLGRQAGTETASRAGVLVPSRRRGVPGRADHTEGSNLRGRRKTVTDAEWDLSRDATAMLQALRGRGGERKMRLLACACARSLWPGLVEEEFRRAVEVAERCADGLTGRDDLRAAWDDIWSLDWGDVAGDCHANAAAYATVEDFPGHAAERAISSISGDPTPLLREIFGNPLRAARADGDWLRDYRGPARDLAGRIYDDRLFEGLPRLADL